MPATSKTTDGECVRTLKVQNKMGIHARPAAMIVRIANRHTHTEVWIEKDDERVNGKSIMGIMMLAAGSDSTLRFVATGPTAEKLLDELEELFNRKFDEV